MIPEYPGWRKRFTSRASQAQPPLSIYFAAAAIAIATGALIAASHIWGMT